MSTEPMPDTTPSPAKRKPGRPPGAKNRRPSSKAATEQQTAPDDLAAAAAAAAAAAVPPPLTGSGGRPTRRASERSALAEQLSTAYAAAGGMLSVAALVIPDAAVRARVAAVAAAITARADECGTALAHWADTNERVKKWLSNLSTGSGLLMVLAAHAPIARAAFAPTSTSPSTGEPAADPTGGMFDLAGLVNLLGGVAAP